MWGEGGGRSAHLVCGGGEGEGDGRGEIGPFGEGGGRKSAHLLAHLLAGMCSHGFFVSNLL